jgi:hypothetical protein
VSELPLDDDQWHAFAGHLQGRGRGGAHVQWQPLTERTRLRWHRRRRAPLTENGRYWGCLVACERLYRLKPPPRYAVDATYGNVALAGPYAGYAQKYDDGQAVFADVHVQHLRNGSPAQHQLHPRH